MLLLIFKPITIVLFIVLCMDIAAYVYGCDSDCGHYHFKDAFERIHNRKVAFGKDMNNGYLHEEKAFGKDMKKVYLHEEKAFGKDMKKGYLHEDASTKNRGNSAWSELRWVPSGPDPLHHNVVTPKRPRTP